MNFEETPEFQKDVKKLKKSWRSIPSDLENAKLAIAPLYVPVQDVNIKDFRDNFFGTKRATVLESTEEQEVVKMRLDCATLGNDKKTRLIFIMIRTANTIQFIELYAKNSNEREDSRRLKKYLRQ